MKTHRPGWIWILELANPNLDLSVILAVDEKGAVPHFAGIRPGRVRRESFFRNTRKAEGESGVVKTHLVSKLVLAGIALAIGGCGIEPETLDSLRDAVNSVSAVSAADARLAAPDPENLQFTPPNPGRSDPFTYSSGTTMETDQPGTSITTASQVYVMGFANVDGPRVFLRTKEVTKLMAIGDKADGVEVIGIHPPAVDLRMGTLEWRATMFDDTQSLRNER